MGLTPFGTEGEPLVFDDFSPPSPLQCPLGFEEASSTVLNKDRLNFPAERSGFDMCYPSSWHSQGICDTAPKSRSSQFFSPSKILDHPTATRSEGKVGVSYEPSDTSAAAVQSGGSFSSKPSSVSVLDSSHQTKSVFSLPHSAGSFLTAAAPLDPFYQLAQSAGLDIFEHCAEYERRRESVMSVSTPDSHEDEMTGSPLFVPPAAPDDSPVSEYDVKSGATHHAMRCARRTSAPPMTVPYLTTANAMPSRSELLILIEKMSSELTKPSELDSQSATGSTLRDRRHKSLGLCHRPGPVPTFSSIEDCVTNSTRSSLVGDTSSKFPCQEPLDESPWPPKYSGAYFDAFCSLESYLKAPTPQTATQLAQSIVRAQNCNLDDTGGSPPSRRSTVTADSADSLELAQQLGIAPAAVKLTGNGTSDRASSFLSTDASSTAMLDASENFRKRVEEDSERSAAVDWNAVIDSLHNYRKAPQVRSSAAVEPPSTVSFLEPASLTVVDDNWTNTASPHLAPVKPSRSSLSESFSCSRGFRPRSFTDSVTESSTCLSLDSDSTPYFSSNDVNGSVPSYLLKRFTLPSIPKNVVLDESVRNARSTRSASFIAAGNFKSSLDCLSPSLDAAERNLAVEILQEDAAAMKDGLIADTISNAGSNSRIIPNPELFFRLDLEPYRNLPLQLLPDVGHLKTTVMLRNVPNKYSMRLLLTVVNREFSCLYDFFYLPIDFRNKCNVGYAFINFKHSFFGEQFRVRFHNYKLDHFKSNKICEVSWGRVQGLLANIEHYRNSSVMSVPTVHYRPTIFDKDGQPSAFPPPTGPVPFLRPRQHHA